MSIPDALLHGTQTGFAILGIGVGVDVEAKCDEITDTSSESRRVNERDGAAQAAQMTTARVQQYPRYKPETREDHPTLRFSHMINTSTNFRSNQAISQSSSRQ
jgi:hypothetical protein